MDDKVARKGESADRATPGARRDLSDRDARGKSKRGYLILLLLLIVMAAFAYWKYSGPTGERAPKVPPAPPQAIGDAEIGKRDITIVLNALGAVTPLATVTVRTQIAGQLQKIGFQEGQLVHKNDFLAQIDPRPYQVTLEQAQGQLAKDQAVLDQGRSDLKRYQTLAKQDSIAKQQADNQVFLVRQYEAAIVSDQAAIDSAKLNLAYCTIVAPLDGRVGLRQVDAGNYVQVTDTNGIVVITELEPMSVLFTIPEDNLPDVQKRMQAGATLTATAFDRSNTKRLAEGALLTTDNQVDPTTGTVKLRALFPNKDQALFPQQFVNIQLLVDTLKDQIAAPAAAIQRGSIGAFVYVVKPDNTVTAKTVVLGPQDGDFVAITSGLLVGDHVVIDGIDRLREGAKVVVRNGAAATNSSRDATPPSPTTEPDGQRRRRRQPQ